MQLLPAIFKRKSMALTPTVDRRPRLDLHEVGGTGSIISGGMLLQQDYNTDLQTPAIYDVYDRMRRSDGQVRAALSVIKLPLLSVDWYVEPASDTPQDIEISDYLNDRIKNMTITWHNMLRQALLCLDYGSMPFEKVWEIRDNLVNLRKLSPRMPKTITKWNMDDEGGLESITQSTYKGGGFGVYDIPVEKLLVFVNEQEGSDYKGTSILRAAYKHWYFKDKLYIIDAISKERRAIGIDVGTLKGPDVDENDRRQLENALMTLHAHEKQFFIEQDERFSYRVEGLRGNISDSMGSIEHHDLRILRSVLAEFLAMGAGSSGSLAMHKDKSTFFLMALESIATNMCDTFNNYLIKQWVDYNWVVDKYPTMCHGRLDTRDISALADAVSKLLSAGGLTAGFDVEEELREWLDLPAQPTPDTGPTPAHDPGRGAEYAVTLFRRTSFAAINRTLDKGEADIVSLVKVQQVKQIDKLVELGMAALRSNNLAKLQDITVPYRGPLAADVAGVLKGLYEDGRNSVASELQMALDLTPEDIMRFITIRAQAVTSVLADRLKSSLVWNALEMFRNDDVDEVKLKAALTNLSDREVRKIAGNTVSEALNLGRDSVAMSSNRPLKAIYSSVLDSGSCTACRSADGLSCTVGDATYNRLRPPYQECEGHSRCRCVFVYVSAAR